MPHALIFLFSRVLAILTLNPDRLWAQSKDLTVVYTRNIVSEDFKNGQVEDCGVVPLNQSDCLEISSTQINTKQAKARQVWLQPYCGFNRAARSLLRS